MFNISHSRLGAACALGLALGLAVAVHPAFRAHAYALHTQEQSASAQEPPAQTQAVQAVSAIPAPVSVTPSHRTTHSGVESYLSDGPKLIKHGYTQAEVDLIFSSLEQVPTQVLLDHSYDTRAVQYIALPYFHPDLLARYLDYGQANPDLDAETVVTYVNIGLDQPAYDSSVAVENPGTTDVLVNKYHALDQSFVPELVKMSSIYTGYSGATMEAEAYEHFQQMVDAARADGLKLYAVSAYRTYSYQNTLYKSYVARNGQASADTYSARAGYSEHQTGLAVDINVSRIAAHFEKTAHYRWLTEHCGEYGFILRYPEGKKNITGFTFEPWHYRYLGVELAQAVLESGLTYDEYMARQPVGDTKSAQAVTVNGEEKDLRRVPLRLDGTYYLAAGDLAKALGITCSETSDGAVVLSASGCTLTITPKQSRCMLNGTEYTLACTPFTQGQDLMVPLANTAKLLEYTVSETDLTLVLKSIANS